MASIASASPSHLVRQSNSHRHLPVHGQGHELVRLRQDDVYLVVQGPPKLSVADVSYAEGDDGYGDGVTLTLSQPSAPPVTVSYRTANGTATAGSDYTAGSGTVTFAQARTT